MLIGCLDLNSNGCLLPSVTLSVSLLLVILAKLKL